METQGRQSTTNQHARGTDTDAAASARETLEAIRSTEARARASQPVPWLAIIATSLCFGAGFYFTLVGHAWGLLILLAGVVGIIWIELSAKRSVRTAMKQEVREDPKLNWKAVVIPLLAYPLMTLAEHVGTVACAIVAAATTIGMIAAYGLTWNKYHD
ncbi:hypothetical protein CKJ81_04540 [Corynebacterium hadale]|uniref:Uncharacterized protein n=2 Tax=Corynebacterium hadale TaxID=2026255 RepID=A0ABX4HB50_9CORY|nr:hypothetical protein CKJ81_04540 [Corynebacterium hadale]